MILKLSTLDKPARDTVVGLSVGYEGDAREGISMADQLARLHRWYRDGWPRMQYHYHVLALVIGYAKEMGGDRTQVQG